MEKIKSYQSILYIRMNVCIHTDKITHWLRCDAMRCDMNYISSIRWHIIVKLIYWFISLFRKQFITNENKIDSNANKYYYLLLSINTHYRLCCVLHGSRSLLNWINCLNGPVTINRWLNAVVSSLKLYLAFMDRLIAGDNRPIRSFHGLFMILVLNLDRFETVFRIFCIAFPTRFI